MVALVWVVFVPLVLLVGAAMAVLVRRDRRRVETGPETWRIEQAATGRVRDARLKARACRDFSSAAGVSTLRNRDPEMWRL